MTKRLLIFFCVLASTASGQITFQKSYSYYGQFLMGYAHQTFDKGYITIGLGGNTNSNTACLIKTDSIGNPVWGKEFYVCTWCGYPAFDIKQTQDSGYIFSYYSSNSNNNDNITIIKFDQQGDTTWKRQMQGHGLSSGFSLEANDGGYIFTGGIPNSFYSDAYLIRTNNKGDTLWTRSYGGAADDVGYSIQQSSDGGYLLFGYTQSFGIDSTDLYLLKTDSTGNLLWSKTFGGAGEDYPIAMERTNDNGFILLGATTSFSSGQFDIYVIKIDSLGNIQWSKTYDTPNNYYYGSIQQTNDSGYIISSSYSSTVFIIKTDSVGDTLWTKGYNSVGNTTVQQTIDNGYIIAGGNLIKTDVNGNSGCNETSISIIPKIVATQYTMPVTKVSSGGTYRKDSIYMDIEAVAVNTICSNVVVEEISDIQSETLFPNPFHTTATIISNSENAQLVIYNIIGTIVQQIRINNKSTIISRDLLADGIYFYQLVSNYGQTASGKFVVE